MKSFNRAVNLVGQLQAEVGLYGSLRMVLQIFDHLYSCLFTFPVHLTLRFLHPSPLSLPTANARNVHSSRGFNLFDLRGSNRSNNHLLVFLNPLVKAYQKRDDGQNFPVSEDPA